MYKRDRRRAAALYLCGGVALGVCAALIVFLVHVLVLRTEYRSVCFEINDAVLSASGTAMSVERGGESWPMSEELLNYYDRNLLAEKTFVINRRGSEPDEKSIILRFSGCALTFTGLEDGSKIALRWETPNGTRCYSLRSDSVSFMQYGAYLTTYVRRLELNGG